MKRLVLLFLGTVFTLSQVNSQDISLTDTEFKSRLLASSSSNTIAKNLDGNFFKIDSNGDGEIQLSEALNVSYLNLDFVMNPSIVLSLDGIESFSNLEYLIAYELGISTFNYSLPNLSELILSYHLIENLDLSNCPSLIALSTIQSPSSNYPLTEICLKNGIDIQSLTVYNAPNLSYVCVDESEKTVVEASLSSYSNVTINSSCNVATFISSNDAGQHVLVFPNPFTSEFSIMTDSEINRIEIINLEGQIVLSTTNSKKINSDLLNPGVFIALIYINEDVFVQKIIKE